jgi:hypothetical protein
MTGIEVIKAAAPLVEIIGRHVKLTRRGREHGGRQFEPIPAGGDELPW